MKAMTVPKNFYKTVTNAWEGYHLVPLDKESSKLNSFVTPFGCFWYLTNYQGNHVSGDAYTRGSTWSLPMCRTCRGRWMTACSGSPL